MIQSIFIRRLYSCTVRAWACDSAFPQDPCIRTPREMRKSGWPCTWDTDDTSKTYGKDSCLLLPGLCLLPAQSEAQTFHLAPGHSQPSATQLTDQQLCWEAQAQHLAALGKLTSVLGCRLGWGEATGKLGLPGDFLLVSFHCALTAPRQSCCSIVAAAPPWEDASSTHVCGAPAQLSPYHTAELNPILSSALARSGLLQTPEQSQLQPIPPRCSRKPTTPKESAPA